MNPLLPVLLCTFSAKDDPIFFFLHVTTILTQGGGYNFANPQKNPVFIFIL